MSETRIKDLTMDKIWDLRQQKKALDEEIKELESKYKKDLFRDGLGWEGDKVLMDMKQTQRLIISPEEFQKTYPGLFMSCAEIKVDKAKAAVQLELKLVTKEEAVEKLKLIGRQVAYQKLLNFKIKEAK